MRHFVVEDTSFIVAIMDKDDVHHKDALFVFQRLNKEYRDKIRFAISSIAFFEAIITLIKKGADKNYDRMQMRQWRSHIEEKLWRLLYIEEVFNLPIIETSAFRVSKKLDVISLTALKTSDFLIISQGIECDAQILTFDVQMRKRVKEAYPYIYYCAGDQAENGIEDETTLFFNDLDNLINPPKSESLKLSDLPF